MINTDMQDLNRSKTQTKVLLGKGTGAGAIPEKGRIAAKESEEKIKKLNVTKDDTDGIAEFLLKIEGMELSLFLREEEGKRKGSLRCNDKYNVNEIASIFNGGGHIKAAGFKIDLPVEEIISKIYKKL